MHVNALVKVELYEILKTGLIYPDDMVHGQVILHVYTQKQSNGTRCLVHAS